jgi:hypothetical protein
MQDEAGFLTQDEEELLEALNWCLSQMHLGDRS